MITSAEGGQLIDRVEPGIPPRNSRAGRIFLVIMFITLMLDALPDFRVGIGPGLSAKNLYLYSLCILIGARAVMNPYGLRFVDLHVHIPFLAAILYAFLTLAISSVYDPMYDTMRGLASLKNKMIDLYLLMFIFRFLVSSRDDFIWLIKAVVVMMFVSAFLTLIDFVNMPDLGIVGTYKGRIEGPIGGANQYGSLLAFLLPISIGTMPRKPGFARWFWRIGILITVILLIGTGSRGAYVGMIAGSAAAVVYMRDYVDLRTVARMTISALGMATVLIIAYLMLNPDFLVNLVEKSTTGDLETASSGRWAIWGAALGVMLEVPYTFLVGYGWNSFESSGIWKSAHSVYFNHFFEVGIIGLAIFIILIRNIVQRSRACLKRADDEASILTKSFVISMFVLAIDIIFVTPSAAWSVMWILIGLMLGLQSTLPHGQSDTQNASANNDDLSKGSLQTIGSQVPRTSIAQTRWQGTGI